MGKAKSMVSWGREGWAGGQKQTISELQTTEEYSQVGRCEMNKAWYLKVIGGVSGGDKKSLASAGPTFLPFRNQKRPNFESVGNNDPRKKRAGFCGLAHRDCTAEANNLLII